MTYRDFSYFYVNCTTAYIPSHVTNESKTHFLVNVHYFYVPKFAGNAYTTFHTIKRVST